MKTLIEFIRSIFVKPGQSVPDAKPKPQLDNGPELSYPRANGNGPDVH